ncbi:uncharacterized protein LOC121735021 [Aricia agestis]|uniref:uncharacterized protein LOC121735021 n=1 Tax=Aricia agestis TaxID=91739 RepID=UPI001C203B1B|nr:uncharacterized protein LOC121735021 [Aricia agestis]
MAYNFDSGQFNKETAPRRLCNWEVPRWAPSRARPVQMRPEPKPICDINGRFLPGAPRGTSKCFGHYTGTWDMPRKITRQVAAELSKEPPDGRFSDWLHLREQRANTARRREDTTFDRTAERKLDDFRANECPYHKNRPKKILNVKLDQDNKSQAESPEVKNDEDPLELNKRIEPTDSDGNGPYVPGAETEDDKRHESYDLLVKDAVEKLHGPQEDPQDKFWRKVAENAKNFEEDENMKLDRKSGTKLPYVNVVQNFSFAKKMHTGNLEHEPLPDTLGYRLLPKVGEHRDSDIVVKPYAIGWKGYGASGPTCCTKMRVHRPKTCEPKKAADEKNTKQRPATSVLGLGGQYKKPLSLMDLAICWDFKPNDTKQEPKPPKHIDGSNGSLAPAVFTMVHTPKEEVQEAMGEHAYSIFNSNQIVDNGKHSVPYFEKDMTKERKKDSCEVQNCVQHNRPKSRPDSRKSSNESVKKCDGKNGCGTPKSDQSSTIKSKQENGRDNSNQSLESYDKTPLAQGKLKHSSPNESFGSSHSKNSNNNAKHRQCTSCNARPVTDKIVKDDYKFAFKAGNPNSVQSDSSKDSKGVKIPKMRHPYTKKSYTIPTLAPPFTIWRDANATGYPEHWRLASVYQHAYKPPEQRRKPLIASVYQ